MPHHGVDLDRAGPVNDNRPDLAARAHQPSKKSKDSRVEGPGKAIPHRVSQYPQASGLPGSLSIIENAGRGRDRPHGIPGILSTTSLGPEQRRKLISGIIDLSEHGRKADGPVHNVSGHDATAMNAGMRPLPGAPVHGHDSEHHHSKFGSHAKHSRVY